MVRYLVRTGLILIGMVMINPDLSAQSIQKDTISFFQPSPEFSKSRFWTAVGIGSVAYGATVYGLNELWYKQYPRSSFHFFDDSGEWQQMDKVGHLATTYYESVLIYKGARWAGMNESAAIWTGVGVSMALQTTVEALDGFSDQWGFSLSDFAFNIIGASAFFAQQKVWEEQRISFKVSSTLRDYPSFAIKAQNSEATTTLENRARDLYGNSIWQSFLKDYNAQTIWASVNLHSFLNKEQSKFPKWLNLAFGYGAENMYGGVQNRWREDDSTFVLSDEIYPRYRQIYLSPDIDFTRIPTKSPFLKTVFSVLNVFKFPAPALEWSGKNGLKLHAIYY